MNAEIKQQILNEYHVKTGNGLANAMKFLIAQKYSWPGMFTEIDNYVKKCKICQKVGEPKVNTKNKVIKAETPNEIWEVDLIGRIPGKVNDNRFILVAIGHLQKMDRNSSDI